MGNYITNDVISSTSFIFDNIKGGVASMQGCRETMEDAHAMFALPYVEEHYFCGVFDGHGGTQVSTYIEKNIEEYFKNSPEWMEYVKLLKMLPEQSSSELVKLCGNAITQILLKMDEDMVPLIYDESGSTAITAIITPTHIICGNVGDSRCVLGTNGKCVEMSFDHKPNNVEESTRIHNAGGFVTDSRVDGALAVSRALGDFSLKDMKVDAYLRKVSACAEIIVHERNMNDEFLFLSCDGVTDVFTSQEIVDSTRKIFESGKCNMQLTAEEMVDRAFDNRSTDNISVMIVCFDGAKFNEEYDGVIEMRRIRHDNKEATRLAKEDNSPEKNQIPIHDKAEQLIRNEIEKNAQEEAEKLALEEADKYISENFSIFDLPK